MIDGLPKELRLFVAASKPSTLEEFNTLTANAEHTKPETKPHEPRYFSTKRKYEDRQSKII